MEGFFIYLIAIICLINKLSCQLHNVSRKGPFVLTKYSQINQGSMVEEVQVLVTEYPSSVKGHLLFVNAWRTAQNYHFLDWYTFEENTYHVNFTKEEARDMVKNKKCKLGKEIKTHSDDECWKDLDQIDRTREVTPPKEFDPDIVEGVAFKSSCKLTWNCGMHEIDLDLFAITEDSFEYNLFVFGPDGNKIRVNGGDELKLNKIHDATLVMKRVEKMSKRKNVTAVCIKDRTVICHLKGDYSVIIEFFGPIATWRNNIYFNPLVEKKTPLVHPISKPVDGNPSDPATKSDLRQVDEKIVFVSEKMIYDVHQIMREFVDLKNSVIEIINSLSKIDEELIGKLTKIPMSTKWLSYLTFVFEAKASTYLSHIAGNKTCIPLFSFENGRWELNKRNLTCIEHLGHSFNIFKNYINDLDSLSDAPGFLNVTNQNEGWKYISGKSIMDLLSPHIKYKDHGSFLDGIFKGWDMKWLIQIGVIAVIVLIVILLACKVMS